MLGGTMWRHLRSPVGKQPRSSRVDAEPELIISAGPRLSLCRMTGCPCTAFPAHPVGPTLMGLSAVWGISQPPYVGSWKRDSNVSGTHNTRTSPLSDSSLWEVVGLEGLEGGTPLLAGWWGGGWAAHGCSRWKPLTRNVCDVVWSSVNKAHELSRTL